MILKRNRSWLKNRRLKEKRKEKRQRRMMGRSPKRGRRRRIKKLMNPESKRLKLQIRSSLQPWKEVHLTRKRKLQVKMTR